MTAVNAESWPTRLKLFRNYDSPRALLDGTPEPPDNEWLWSAARATGAAPTFFRYGLQFNAFRTQYYSLMRKLDSII